MTRLDQKHWLTTANDPTNETAHPPHTNHDFNYVYGDGGPHQATKIGDRNLVYDANGNTLRECRDHGDTTCQANSDKLRRYFWGEENELNAVIDGGGWNITRFIYDAGGQRVAKLGRGGESITVGQFFALKGRKAATKHVFIGETRVASKLLPSPGWEPSWSEGTTVAGPIQDGTAAVTTDAVSGCNPSTYQPQKCPIDPAANPVIDRRPDTTKIKPATYYYHSDHLGSTSWVTDQNGRVHEHVEYFPYGEVWRDARYDSDGDPVHRQQFLFSSKEMDEETGLYYFGARYEDPARARWLSADPDMLKDATPASRGDGRGQYRAGEAGRWPMALSAYAYANWDPTTWSDPDGRSALWKAVRVAGQGIKKLFRLNRRTAKELAKKGVDIAAGSGKEAKQLAKEVSKEVGGGGKVVMHEGHPLKEGGVGEPHAHPKGPDGKSYKAPGTSGPHIFFESLMGVMFDIFDSNGDGTINYNDAGEWLNPLPIEMPTTAFPDAFSPRRRDDFT